MGTGCLGGLCQNAYVKGERGDFGPVVQVHGGLGCVSVQCTLQHSCHQCVQTSPGVFKKRMHPTLSPMRQHTMQPYIQPIQGNECAHLKVVPFQSVVQGSVAPAVSRV